MISIIISYNTYNISNSNNYVYITLQRILYYFDHNVLYEIYIILNYLIPIQ